MPSPDAVPKYLLPVLDRLTQILNEHQVAYALIGGLGVALRGPIRTTRDKSFRSWTLVGQVPKTGTVFLT